MTKTKRMMYMLIGILFIGICVSSYRLSGFGVDPFTCMNLGISSFLGISFGNWQLIMNGMILVAVWFQVRHLVGLGTVVNMAGVGYIADFLCWLVQNQLHFSMNLPVRILLLITGTFFASLGCSLYMTADLGISPYDAVAFMIVKAVKGKISFRVARISSDFTVMLIGVAFCLAGQNRIGQIVGLGTLVNALLNGPFIQFWNKRLQNKHTAMP